MMCVQRSGLFSSIAKKSKIENHGRKYQEHLLNTGAMPAVHIAKNRRLDVDF